jgi:hypothetical protein
MKYLDTMPLPVLGKLFWTNPGYFYGFYHWDSAWYYAANSDQYMTRNAPGPLVSYRGRYYA